MNAHTRQVSLQGPAGALQCAVDAPHTPLTAPVGLAVICHPHPLHGGTMDNKVVQTLARALVQLGWTAVRFNFRGVGASEGAWDQGRGEAEDAQAVIQGFRAPDQPLVLAGFSFGAYVAAQVASRLEGSQAAHRLVLVGPAVENFAVPPVPQDSLVIHGEQDEIVALSCVLDWARPHVIPVTVVPGASHFFHGHLPLLKTLVFRALGAAIP